MPSCSDIRTLASGGGIPPDVAIREAEGMTQDFALYVLKDALITAALVAAPVLLAILVVGLLISILQVATQVQEMTLTFIPKLAVTVMTQRNLHS
ncbi:UNVERIFIED_CONTAM: fliQ [Trichonephila clavipes]